MNSLYGKGGGVSYAVVAVGEDMDEDLKKGISYLTVVQGVFIVKS